MEMFAGVEGDVQVLVAERMNGMACSRIVVKIDAYILIHVVSQSPDFACHVGITAEPQFQITMARLTTVK